MKLRCAFAFLRRGLRTLWQKFAIFTPKIIRTSVGQARATEFLDVGYSEIMTTFSSGFESEIANLYMNINYTVI